MTSGSITAAGAGPARAVRRVPSRATGASTIPTIIWSSVAAGIASGVAYPETEPAQDCVSDRRGRQIAEPHPEHQWPWKIDPRCAAVDAALDAPGGPLSAGEKGCRPVP